LIEWGSKIPQIFPEEYLQINIEIVGPSERRWIFYPKGNKYMEKVNEIERIWKE
ncbi:MAG: tRNA (adenosine(37)-N6)-threonylcarbamoyltransferase complex ATPase subunit type 1 TsaE, partial [Planctomycetota bacterium]